MVDRLESGCVHHRRSKVPWDHRRTSHACHSVSGPVFLYGAPVKHHENEVCCLVTKIECDCCGETEVIEKCMTAFACDYEIQLSKLVCVIL